MTVRRILIEPDARQPVMLPERAVSTTSKYADGRYYSTILCDNVNLTAPNVRLTITCVVKGSSGSAEKTTTLTVKRIDSRRFSNKILDMVLSQ